MLTHTLPFDPAHGGPSLASLPECPGIFALFGSDPKAEPYLGRTTNLRRRLKRFLDARPDQTKRLRLTERISLIEYTATGSDFESTLALYNATIEAFGGRSRKRLRLHAPYFLRMTVKNRYPRVYVTNTIARSAADCLFGPFPSRTAAERFCDESLNLFQLRRCYPDLVPDPDFPGCVYSEMKMCLAPCFKGCTDERYAEEAVRVQAFLASRGQSLLDALARERDAASADLDFERAATLHSRIQKVESVAALASEAVRPLSQLRALLIQPSAESGHVALFQLTAGLLTGPVPYNTFGMRLHNEQSGSSSLYAHPYALEAVPLQESSAPSPFTAATIARRSSDAPRNMLEKRLTESISQLGNLQTKSRSDAQTLADHLSLLARWYYRPSIHRIGELIFCEANGTLPSKQILRAISRVFRETISVADAAATQ